MTAIVTPEQVAKQIEARTPPFLLDVRTAPEFMTDHVPGAVNIPVGELGTRLAEVPRDRAVVVYCEHGPRAMLAARVLGGNGYDQVSLMEGSMTAWRAAELPVEP